MKIINKKGFLWRDFIIAFILFSAVITLFVLFVGGISGEYDAAERIVSPTFSENYDRLTEVTRVVNQSRAESVSDEGLSFLGTLSTIFRSTVTVIRLGFASLTSFGEVGNNLASDFGLELSVISVLLIVGLSIITTILVFVWLSSISRGRL